MVKQMKFGKTVGCSDGMTRPRMEVSFVIEGPQLRQGPLFGFHWPRRRLRVDDGQPEVMC